MPPTATWRRSSTLSSHPRDATRGALAQLDRATVWLNSEPLTAHALRGRVVLVDFWTYSCVNWLRTLPYVSAWAERYGERGFVVVGAHAPEFGFEHDLEGVRRATADLGSATQSSSTTTSRSGGRSATTPGLRSTWSTSRGACAFATSARMRTRRPNGPSKSCWASTRSSSTSRRPVSPRPPTGSPCGRPRPTWAARAASAASTRADGLTLNRWTLAGDWTLGEESAVLEAPGGSIAYRFEGRDLNLVLTPPASGDAARFAVRLDGRPPGDDHGLDVDASGRARSTSRGCTSSCAGADLPGSGPSRSRSATPA